MLSPTTGVTHNGDLPAGAGKAKRTETGVGRCA
jgi:hypothetical protein